MKTIYPSKIGLELALPILLLLGGQFLFFIWQQLYFESLIPLIILLSISYLAANIRYIITDQTLFIKAGIFANLSIPITNIRKINPSRSWMSSPAASIDRLAIHYGKYDSVLISPKDKQGFIDQLKSINPNIELD